MKQLYTSYYAKHGSDPNAIAISASVPPYYNGKRYEGLAPSWTILRKIQAGFITDEQYAEMYLDELDKKGLTSSIIYDSLPNGAILICYERAGEFCHRRVLAEKLEQELGIEIPEISLLTKSDFEDFIIK